ncbi:MAG: hypothetical protein HY435_03145 [Candidatus Liptonbacteria bacterium]|nr:hypothetical protein [Candidatus Liptonbacteria bacterium]
MSSSNAAREFKKNILGWNLQLGFSHLTTSNLRVLARARPKSIVVVGIGGSGLAGDILSSVRREIGLRIPLFIWKDYGTPGEETAGLLRPLYVFVSFSGNTEETLSGLEGFARAGKIRENVAVVTTGGKMKSLAERLRLPCVEFPAGSLTPRQATGSMFYGIVTALRAAGLGLRVPVFPRIRSARGEHPAKALARQLKKRLLLFYTDESYRPVGAIWKIKCNETAKTLAFANVVPEMNHNELVGFETLRVPASAIFFEDPGTYPRTKKDFESQRNFSPPEAYACIP